MNLQKATARRTDKRSDGHIEIGRTSLVAVKTALVVLQRNHVAQWLQIILVLLLFARRRRRHLEYFDS